MVAVKELNIRRRFEQILDEVRNTLYDELKESKIQAEIMSTVTSPNW